MNLRVALSDILGHDRAVRAIALLNERALDLDTANLAVARIVGDAHLTHTETFAASLLLAQLTCELRPETRRPPGFDTGGLRANEPWGHAAPRPVPALHVLREAA